MSKRKFTLQEILDDYVGIFNEHHNYREFIIENICGSEYVTHEILERHLDEIIDRIEQMKKNLGHETEYGDYMEDEEEATLYYFNFAIFIFNCPERRIKRDRITNISRLEHQTASHYSFIRSLRSQRFIKFFSSFSSDSKFCSGGKSKDAIAGCINKQIPADYQLFFCPQLAAQSALYRVAVH